MIIPMSATEVVQALPTGKGRPEPDDAFVDLFEGLWRGARGANIGRSSVADGVPPMTLIDPTPVRAEPASIRSDAELSSGHVDDLDGEGIGGERPVEASSPLPTALAAQLMAAHTSLVALPPQRLEQIAAIGIREVSRTIEPSPSLSGNAPSDLAMSGRAGEAIVLGIAPTLTGKAPAADPASLPGDDHSRSDNRRIGAFPELKVVLADPTVLQERLPPGRALGRGAGPAKESAGEPRALGTVNRPVPPPEPPPTALLLAATVEAARAVPLSASVETGSVGLSTFVTRQLDVARDGAWLDGLARDIASTASGERLSFALRPEALGHLNVAIERHEGVMHIRLATENEDARSIMTDAQPRLLEEIRAQGVRVSGSPVSSDAGAGPHQRPPIAPSWLIEAERPEADTSQPTIPRRPAGGRFA